MTDETETGLRAETLAKSARPAETKELEFREEKIQSEKIEEIREHAAAWRERRALIKGMLSAVPVFLIYAAQVVKCAEMWAGTKWVGMWAVGGQPPHENLMYLADYILAASVLWLAVFWPYCAIQEKGLGEGLAVMSSGWLVLLVITVGSYCVAMVTTSLVVLVLRLTEDSLTGKCAAVIVGAVLLIMILELFVLSIPNPESANDKTRQEPAPPPENKAANGRTATANEKAALL